MRFITLNFIPSPIYLSTFNAVSVTLWAVSEMISFDGEMNTNKD